MAKRTKYKFSIEGLPLYPHIKLTRERFPRILVTRIPGDDDAEYFGAFLNRSNARLLVDFLNRTFKLRSCEISVDGSFNYPCTMYYKRRCLAPCVSDLIDDSDYTAMVDIVRLFLQNERMLLRVLVNTRIRSASDRLDFETSAKWRDILNAVEDHWADVRHAVWLDGTSDTWHLGQSRDALDVFLITQKGRRVLGERVFSFAGCIEADADQALSEVIEQFYRFHAPKEMRVSRDFTQRKELEESISLKFGRRVPILVLNEKNRKVSTGLALFRSASEIDARRSLVTKSSRELMEQLKHIFNLPKTPERITAVDVSHIAGTHQIAAAIVWENGKSISSEYLLSGANSELETLSEFITQLFGQAVFNEPQLLLIDGGQSQLNAAMVSCTSENIYIRSAVKPPGEHSEVSHFLASDRRIEFDPKSEAHWLLRRLRDEAHDFSNAVHRDVRDFETFYGIVNILPSLKEYDRQRLLVYFGSLAAILNSTREEIAKAIGIEQAQVAVEDIHSYQRGKSHQIKPLIVPVRFQDKHGAADDLRPIEATRRDKRRRQNTYIAARKPY